MTRKRWLRWILAACLTPVLLVLVVLLSSPLWLNQELVKREVTKIISGATGGKAQFERIDVHLLPFPGVVVSRLRFSLPGTLEVEAQSAAVDIRLLPLLIGKVYPHRVQLIAPQVRVQLDEPKPSPQPPPQSQPQPFSLKDTEASVRGVLEQIEKARARGGGRGRRGTARVADRSAATVARGEARRSSGRDRERRLRKDLLCFKPVRPTRRRSASGVQGPRRRRARGTRRSAGAKPRPDPRHTGRLAGAGGRRQCPTQVAHARAERCAGRCQHRRAEESRCNSGRGTWSWSARPSTPWHRSKAGPRR